QRHRAIVGAVEDERRHPDVREQVSHVVLVDELEQIACVARRRRRPLVRAEGLPLAGAHARREHVHEGTAPEPPCGTHEADGHVADPPRREGEDLPVADRRVRDAATVEPEETRLLLHRCSGYARATPVARAVTSVGEDSGYGGRRQPILSMQRTASSWNGSTF